VTSTCCHAAQAVSSLTKLRCLRVSLREGLVITWPDLAPLKALERLDLCGCPAYAQPWAAWGPIPDSISSLQSLQTLSVR
jgi:hypothetical protein